eukprot:5233039-Pyramimonas_sp.AAC.1
MVRLDRLALSAFPAEAAEEGARDDVDAIVGDDDVATVSKGRLKDEEQYILEQISPARGPTACSCECRNCECHLRSRPLCGRGFPPGPDVLRG